MLQTKYISMKTIFQKCSSSNFEDSKWSIYFNIIAIYVINRGLRPTRSIDSDYQYFFSESSFPFSSHIYQVPDFFPSVYCIS